MSHSCKEVEGQQLGQWRLDLDKNSSKTVSALDNLESQLTTSELVRPSQRFQVY